MYVSQADVYITELQAKGKISRNVHGCSVCTDRLKALKRVDHKSLGIYFLDCLKPKHGQGCCCAVPGFFLKIRI